MTRVVPGNSLPCKNRLQLHNSRFVHRRLPPISTCNPLKPTPTTSKPPSMTTTGPQRVITRATSAPPKSSAVSSRLGTSTTRPLVPSTRDVTVRSVSSTYIQTKAPPLDEEDPSGYDQVCSSARLGAADAARLAAGVEPEWAKLPELGSCAGCHDV